MKAPSSLVFLCVSLSWSQSAPPPDKVIANFPDDGSKITVGELQTLIPLLPETYRRVAEQDPQRFVRLLALFKKEAAAVDSKKLADQSPYKQGLDFAILEAKARLYVQESQLSITVSPEEIERYYNDHKEPFRRLKVSGIKVAYGGSAAPDAGASSVNSSRVPKKVLTEDEAKAKATKLVVSIRAGADFAKLVQTESDDETSKAKGGDLGVWGMTDNVPDALRAAVLGLNEGEISEPIPQPGGFYIVHVDAVTYTPLADVRDSLFSQLKEDKARQWLDEIFKSVKVDFVKDDQSPAPAPSDPKK